MVTSRFFPACRQPTRASPRIRNVSACQVLFVAYYTISRASRRVVEAALRETATVVHLAAFEHQFVLVTLARLLALLSLAGRLAHTRAPLLAHPFGARLRRGGYSSAADAMPALSTLLTHQKQEVRRPQFQQF